MKTTHLMNKRNGLTTMFILDVLYISLFCFMFQSCIQEEINVQSDGMFKTAAIPELTLIHPDEVCAGEDFSIAFSSTCGRIMIERGYINGDPIMEGDVIIGYEKIYVGLTCDRIDLQWEYLGDGYYSPCTGGSFTENFQEVGTYVYRAKLNQSNLKPSECKSCVTFKGNRLECFEVTVVENPVISIAEIQGGVDTSPMVGSQCIISGTVTAVIPGYGYFIQDAIASWSGIYVIDNNNTVVEGNGVKIEGIVVERNYYNLPGTNNYVTALLALNVELINPPLEITPFLVPSPNDARNEKYESVLIALENTRFQGTPNPDGSWVIRTADTNYITVDDFLYSYTPVNGHYYDVIGIIFDTQNVIYKINPRRSADVIDLTTSIAQIQGVSEISPMVGSQCLITGKVTGVVPGFGYFIWDRMAPWCGIFVADATTIVSEGNEVKVEGIVSEINSVTTLNAINVQIINPPYPASTYLIVSPNEAKSEKYESVLVKIVGALFLGTPNPDGSWLVQTDVSNNILINDWIYPYSPIDGHYYTITGVINGESGLYRVEPRKAVDVIDLTTSTP